jgi:hypothetical protein
LVEIAVHEWSLTPVIVSNLFPNLSGLTAHGEQPVIPSGSQRNMFDGVPKILPLRPLGKRRISKETPIIVFAK